MQHAAYHVRRRERLATTHAVKRRVLMQGSRLPDFRRQQKPRVQANGIFWARIFAQAALDAIALDEIQHGSAGTVLQCGGWAGADA